MLIKKFKKILLKDNEWPFLEKFVLILMTSQKIVNFNNISRTFLNGYHDGISSFIWKYYIEVESGWKCSICGEVFNYGKTSGSTLKKSM